MPRFCANLTWLFTELPFLERFEAANRAGFRAVEVLFPYEFSASLVVEQLRRHSLTMALINCPPPSYSGAASGYAAIPSGEERFRSDFKRALRYVARFKAEHLHLMAGVAEGDAARETFVRNLRWAAAEAPTQSLTIEPINPHDMPGYFLNDFDLASSILDEVAAPNVNLQFDAYHAQRIHGDAFAVWEKYGPRAVHIQVAQTPGRNEPAGGGAGAIDFCEFFRRVDASGYSGWISGEYRPAGNTAEGLNWIFAH